MPLLNVGFMTADPMLADCFSVLRRLDIVASNGRVSANPDQQFQDLHGVVTQQDPSDLIKTEDGQTIPRRILICAQFQFIVEGPGCQPDEITWNGIVYTAVSSLPYSRYGDGHYECIAEFRGPVPPLQ